MAGGGTSLRVVLGHQVGLGDEFGYAALDLGTSSEHGHGRSRRDWKTGMGIFSPGSSQRLAAVGIRLGSHSAGESVAAAVAAVLWPVAADRTDESRRSAGAGAGAGRGSGFCCRAQSVGGE